MTVEDIIGLIQEVHEDCEREEDQGLLQHDLHKAEQALAGKYACDRILRKVEARSGIRVMRSPNAGRAR